MLTTASETRPTVSGQLPHLPALDGLRGVAVLAVVLFHLDHGLLPGGYLGVSMFFTLSGFLITRLLIHEAATTGTVSLRQFFDRRFRRLLPAASVTIIGTAIWVLAIGRRSLLPAGDIRAAALWHFNWHELSKEVAYGAADSSALAHFWSLAIEEQFYFVYPVLIFALIRVLGQRAIRPTIIIGAGLTIVMALAIDQYFNTFSRLFEILAGCVVALVPPFRTSKPIRTAVTVIATGITVALMRVTVLPGGGELPTMAIFMTTAATAAIIVVSLSGGKTTFLSRPAIRAIGTYSYSIYLWHWPVFVMIDGLVPRLLLTAALSLSSFHLVEQPLRRLRAA